MPQDWNSIFNDRATSVWDKVTASGAVDCDQLLWIAFQTHSQHDGDNAEEAAYALSTVETDPAQALERLLQNSDPEVRTYAALVAGHLRDRRFYHSLLQMRGDKTALGQFAGDWHWDTVGKAAAQAALWMQDDEHFLEDEPFIPGWLVKARRLKIDPYED